MNATPVAPSTERRQHNRITRDRRQIADTAGLIGDPWIAETTLGRLERNGDIKRRQRLAGEQFQNLFRLAALDPLKASSFTQPMTKPGVNPNLGIEPAKRQVNNALDALGGLASPCGDVAWHVLGCELSMRDYSLRHGKMRREVAKGALVGALAILAKHFGYAKP